MRHRKHERHPGLKNHPCVREAPAPSARDCRHGPGAKRAPHVPVCRRPLRLPSHGRRRVGKERRGAAKTRTSRTTEREAGVADAKGAPMRAGERGAQRVFVTRGPASRSLSKLIRSYRSEGGDPRGEAPPCMARMFAPVSQRYLAREDVARGGGAKVLDCLPRRSFWSSFW